MSRDLAWAGLVLALCIAFIVGVLAWSSSKSEECEAAGGVLTRNGCISKEVFIEP